MTACAGCKFNVHFVNKKKLEVDLICCQIDHRHAINSLDAQLLIINPEYFDGVFDSEQACVFYTIQPLTFFVLLNPTQIPCWEKDVYCIHVFAEASVPVFKSCFLWQIRSFKYADAMQ